LSPSWWTFIPTARHTTWQKAFSVLAIEKASAGQVSSSEYQESSTKINVLLPDDLKRSRRYRALYVLSVDAGDGMQFGDALGEVRRLELQNRYSLSAFMLRSLKPRGMRTIR